MVPSEKEKLVLQKALEKLTEIPQKDIMEAVASQMDGILEDAVTEQPPPPAQSSTEKGRKKRDPAKQL
ncbi:hypothetical protein L0F63_006703, partial [Massospora cicadina]